MPLAADPGEMCLTRAGQQTSAPPHLIAIVALDQMTWSCSAKRPLSEISSLRLLQLSVRRQQVHPPSAPTKHLPILATRKPTIPLLQTSSTSRSAHHLLPPILPTCLPRLRLQRSNQQAPRRILSTPPKLLQTPAQVSALSQMVKMWYSIQTRIPTRYQILIGGSRDPFPGRQQ